MYFNLHEVKRGNTELEEYQKFIGVTLIRKKRRVLEVYWGDFSQKKRRVLEVKTMVIFQEKGEAVIGRAVDNFSYLKGNYLAFHFVIIY